MSTIRTADRPFDVWSCSLRAGLLVAHVALLSCASGSTPAPAAAAGSPAAASPPPTALHAPPEAPAGFRLPGGVAPTGYRLALTLDPASDRFSGRVEIDVELARATRVIWLHARELTLGAASVSAGGKRVAAEVLEGGRDRVGLVTEQPIAAGKAKLTIRYRGKVSTTDRAGIFREKEVDDWYLFTQFEALDARRAFPGFDEPQFKVPFQLALTVPDKLRAFSNAPALGRKPAKGKAGYTTVRFARTPPLPTYLVAFAVGPFDVVDAGRIGRRKISARIIVPKGRSADARYAVGATRAILQRLEAYFGRPYPYAKLDQVAVPAFGGGMENPGLITYRQSLLLSHGRRDSIQRRRSFAGVCAHELAHIWFGDLVTMKWWDDLWLNEAFASWMANKIITQWKPQWNGPVRRVRSRSWAMRADSLVSARKIRQPIRSPHDIRSAFDGITYNKGAAVLAMFEAWLGDVVFRDGVRAYLKEHAFASATAADFLTALSRGRQADVKAAFSTFLDQSGLPLLTMGLSCEAGGPAKLRLQQQRYLPIGARGSGARRWRVPVCVSYGRRNTSARRCALLVAKRDEIELPAKAGCPSWVLGNADMAGYYRVRYEGDLLERLVGRRRTKLAEHELVGLVDDITALVAAGKLRLAKALGWAAPLLAIPSRHVTSRVADLVAGLDLHLVPDDRRPHYARFVRAVFGRKARRLGWRPRKKESADSRLLRARLVPLVADLGSDRRLAAAARRLAQRWLKNRDAVDPELVDAVLHTAARTSGEKLYTALLAAARGNRDRKERRRLLAALGAFEDPALIERNLSLVLSGDFPLHETMALIWGALHSRRGRSLAYRFVKARFSKLRAGLPSWGARYLISSVGVLCDTEREKDAKAFFAGRAEKVPGGPRALAQALERIRRCAARKAALQPQLSAFLTRY